MYAAVEQIADRRLATAAAGAPNEAVVALAAVAAGAGGPAGSAVAACPEA